VGSVSDLMALMEADVRKAREGDRQASLSRQGFTKS